MEAVSYFFMAWTDLSLLLMVAVGTLAGIYVGAIPGLSVTMAASILISFTFKWPVEDALALIAGIYLGGVYGGSRTAILLNIPGTPASAATSLDGYPLAQQGRAGEEGIEAFRAEQDRALEGLRVAGCAKGFAGRGQGGGIEGGEPVGRDVEYGGHQRADPGRWWSLRRARTWRRRRAVR